MARTHVWKPMRGPIVAPSRMNLDLPDHALRCSAGPPHGQPQHPRGQNACCGANGPIFHSCRCQLGHSQSLWPSEPSHPRHIMGRRNQRFRLSRRLRHVAPELSQRHAAPRCCGPKHELPGFKAIDALQAGRSTAGKLARPHSTTRHQGCINHPRTASRSYQGVDVTFSTRDAPTSRAGLEPVEPQGRMRRL